MAQLRRCANARYRRERGQFEERELVWWIAASTSAVAAMRIRGFRAMMVWSTIGVSGARRHAHGRVHRSRAVHGARWLNEEKSAVRHEPESNKWTQHTCSDRATRHARKV
jgi:hypothetical protein